MTHEELQSALPAYVADRLSGEDLDRLREHLAACSECRSVAETWESLAGALRADEVNLFEPHPDPLEVRSLALGITNGTDQASTRLHVTTCASCELEAQIWRRQEAAPARPAAPAPAVSRGGVTAVRLGLLSAAAGAVLGVALSVALLRAAPVSSPEVDVWAGPTSHILLREAVRGGFGDSLTHVIRPDERRVVVSFRAVDGGFSQDGDYRFTITSGSREVLSRAMTGAEARRYLEGAGVVTFDLPASSLTPGRYECTVSGREGSILYRTILDIHAAD
jgi:anti-sigma factor RsiW